MYVFEQSIWCRYLLILDYYYSILWYQVATYTNSYIKNWISALHFVDCLKNFSNFLNTIFVSLLRRLIIILERKTKLAFKKVLDIFRSSQAAIFRRNVANYKTGDQITGHQLWRYTNRGANNLKITIIVYIYKINKK